MCCTAHAAQTVALHQHSEKSNPNLLSKLKRKCSFIVKHTFKGIVFGNLELHCHLVHEDVINESINLFNLFNMSYILIVIPMVILISTRVNRGTGDFTVELF